MRPDSSGQDNGLGTDEADLKPQPGLKNDLLPPPYPGLRPFATEELSLFFGRDDMRDEMVRIFEERNFLAVLGASGSGKSSLVRTAFMSALFAGQAQKAGTQWMIADVAHPAQTNPFKELAKALLTVERQEMGLKCRGSPSGSEVEQFARYLRSPNALREWFDGAGFRAGKKLIILVDQFEELFRYKRFETDSGDFDKDHADAFVSRLIEAMNNDGLNSEKQSPIYFVMTMRAEFLSVCTTLSGSNLIEYISKYNVIPTRMSEQDIRLAISGPCNVTRVLFLEGEFEIEQELVEEILNDLERMAPWERDESDADQVERLARRADQLPLMQHVLRFMWRRQKTLFEDGEIPELKLTLACYREIGGLLRAIDTHAEEIMRNWSPEKTKGTELVFRMLVDGDSVDKAIRRPCTISQLSRETQVGEELISEIVNEFRDKDHAFLTPVGNESLEADTKIDISHESLIRQWTEFREWMKEEAKLKRNWQRLLERSKKRKDGKRSKLLVGVELFDADRFWTNQNPNPDWAARYNKKPRAGVNDNEDDEAQFYRVKNYFEKSKRFRAVRIFLFAVVPALTIAIITYFANEAYSTNLQAQELAEIARKDSLAANQKSQEAETRSRMAEARSRMAEETSQAAEARRLEAEAAIKEVIADSIAAQQVARAASGRAAAMEIRAREVSTNANTVAQELESSVNTMITLTSLLSPNAARSNLDQLRPAVNSIGSVNENVYQRLKQTLNYNEVEWAARQYDSESLKPVIKQQQMEDSPYVAYSKGRIELLKRNYSEAASNFDRFGNRLAYAKSKTVTPDQFGILAGFWSDYARLIDPKASPIWNTLDTCAKFQSDVDNNEYGNNLYTNHTKLRCNVLKNMAHVEGTGQIATPPQLSNLTSDQNTRWQTSNALQRYLFKKLMDNSARNEDENRKIRRVWQRLKGFRPIQSSTPSYSEQTLMQNILLPFDSDEVEDSGNASDEYIADSLYELRGRTIENSTLVMNERLGRDFSRNNQRFNSDFFKFYNDYFGNKHKDLPRLARENLFHELSTLGRLNIKSNMEYLDTQGKEKSTGQEERDWASLFRQIGFLSKYLGVLSKSANKDSKAAEYALDYEKKLIGRLNATNYYRYEKGYPSFLQSRVDWDCSSLSIDKGWCDKRNETILNKFPTVTMGGSPSRPNPYIVYDRENVALGGYDIVSCFKSSESGDNPNPTKSRPKVCRLAKGNADIVSEHAGIFFHFRNRGNKRKFEDAWSSGKDKNRYLPILFGLDFGPSAASRSRRNQDFPIFSEESVNVLSEEPDKVISRNKNLCTGMYPEIPGYDGARVVTRRDLFAIFPNPETTDWYVSSTDSGPYTYPLSVETLRGRMEGDKKEKFQKLISVCLNWYKS